MARKRKTLPKDFEAMLDAGDLDALKKVFDVCELDAHGGVWKTTALGFDDCPDELTRWLVGQGLDVDAPDSGRCTPLYRRAGAGRDVSLLLELGADVNGGRAGYPIIEAVGHPETVRVLAEHGADLNVVDSAGSPLHVAALRSAESTRILLEHGADPSILDWRRRTPLHAALQDCQNIYIPRVAGSTRLLLAAGCPVPDNAVELVSRIGAQFEFYRDGFMPDYLDATEAALADLYQLFGVSPVARRTVHDGSAPITVTATGWRAQFDELWDLLVPGSGPAKTVQGEVIRAAGRISRELLDNGGANWDRDFRKMKDALITHLGSATPVVTADELTSLSKGITRDDYDDAAIQRISELAVAWVQANPNPIPLAEPAYRR